MGPLVGVWLCTIFFNSQPVGLRGTFTSYEEAHASFLAVTQAARLQTYEADVFELRCAYEGV